MKTLSVTSLAVVATLAVTAAQQRPAVPSSGIYHDTWIDLNKNGQKDPYEDSTVATDKRVEDLLGRMTLDEKTCQLATLYGYARLLKDEQPTPAWKQEIWKDGIGNIDEQLNGVPGIYPPSKLTYPPSVHVDALNNIQRWFVEQTRLGIPAEFTNEGIRGLAHDRATSFPAQLGMASAWDRDLIEQEGVILAREARALGYTNIYSPILDLSRDPRWGRVVETFSEDPYLVSTFARIQVKAMQANHVVSTVKHFAVYSVPKGGRDGTARTDPEVTPRELEMVYLRQFEAAIKDAGALGVMASYNDYDGIPIAANHYFLTDILRGRWGFKGYVVSDSKAVEFIESKHHVAPDYPDAVRQTVEAGLNIRTEFTPPEIYINAVRGLARDKKLPIAMIDDRVRDVLRVKFWEGLFDKPYPDAKSADGIVRNPQHLETALRAAHESIVLLKNDGNVLPLRKDLRSILVTGPNAAEVRNSMSRYGPTNLNVVTILDGIKAKVGSGTQVLYTKGSEFADAGFPETEILPVPPNAEEQAEINKARDMARQVDAAVVALGESEDLVGESRSRTSLDLTGFQMELVKAVHAAGKPTVVVMLNGRPMTINWIDKNVPAIVEAWFQGEFCGTAIADVLFGDYNPAGKLPLTFPKTVGQIPFNFPSKRGSQVPNDQLNAQEKKTLVNGALYPFGYGLSYTTYKYSNLAISPVTQTPAGTIQVSVDVENTGKRAGSEIVQLYVDDKVTSVVYYDKVLRGFERVPLQPGEKKTVHFTLGPDDLKLLDRNMKWTVEPGEFEVQIGASSEDVRVRGSFRIQ
jgi:beta-glucosidase